MLLETCFTRFRAMREAYPDFPRVLPASPDEPIKPMLLGIRQRATALLPDEGQRKRLAKAIDLYARSPAYYQACLAPGAMRWSDDGAVPVEPVSEEQRAWAAEQLARRRRWFEAQAAARQAQQAKEEAEQQASVVRKAQRRQAQEAARAAKKAAKKQPPPPKAKPSSSAAIGSPQPAAARPPVVVEIRKPRRLPGAGRRPAPR